jgi:prepilin-type N-terminal cleavage/methylation domain-containing protein/prepilin-type processing-associated H-X9-DG protein
MRLHRRRGFTLIELLVVIAIIGILAAMLFPVFARARESARKIQCLSNVKNIAMAFQMYFSDYDAFPPAEVDAGILSFFAEQGCSTDPACCGRPSTANPYLRWPVILDEYIKNRDVWKCPSANYSNTPTRINGHPNWFQAVQDNFTACICQEYYPSGWGGTVTDNVTLVDGCPSDHLAGEDTGAPQINYGDTHLAGDTGKKLAAINDPAKHMVVVERGRKAYWGVEQIAYPDTCRIMWGQMVNGCCRGATWENCPEVANVCSPVDAQDINKFWTDASMRSKWTRHMGGNNIGFADGHAKWWPADAMIAAANADPQGIEPVDPQCVP